jgi:hypothetical protein
VPLLFRGRDHSISRLRAGDLPAHIAVSGRRFRGDSQEKVRSRNALSHNEVLVTSIESVCASAFLAHGLMGSKLGTIFARAGYDVISSYSHITQKLEAVGQECRGKTTWHSS